MPVPEPAGPRQPGPALLSLPSALSCWGIHIVPPWALPSIQNCLPPSLQPVLFLPSVPLTSSLPSVPLTSPLPSVSLTKPRSQERCCSAEQMPRFLLHGWEHLTW